MHAHSKNADVTQFYLDIVYGQDLKKNNQFFIYRSGLLVTFLSAAGSSVQALTSH